MDQIYLAERLFRVIRTRQTQLTEIIINNQVKDWNDYQNHLGQLRYFKLYRTGTLGPAKETGAK
jgi:hypothetical protein